jgi:hypothetical protein
LVDTFVDKEMQMGHTHLVNTDYPDELGLLPWLTVDGKSELLPYLFEGTERISWVYIDCFAQGQIESNV